eukprot:4231928-Alexandrium_andersonii.AAC.1
MVASRRCAIRSRGPPRCSWTGAIGPGTAWCRSAGRPRPSSRRTSPTRRRRSGPRPSTASTQARTP